MGPNERKRDGKSSLREEGPQRILKQGSNWGEYASGESAENTEGGGMESADGLERGHL